MAESRNVTFGEIPSSTQLKPTTRKINGDSVNTEGDSSSAENTDDFSVTNNEEIARPLKKLLDLNSRGTENPLPTGQEGPAAEDAFATPPPPEGADSEQTTRTPRQVHCRQIAELEAQHVWAHAQGVASLPSHEGLISHQRRELRNLGLITSPTACDAK